MYVIAQNIHLNCRYILNLYIFEYNNEEATGIGETLLFNSKLNRYLRLQLNLWWLLRSILIIIKWLQ